MKCVRILWVMSMATGCGAPGNHSTGKIIGGESSKAPAYFVSLFHKGEKTPFCGGTLVAPRQVLTAAHCVSGVSGEIEVRIAVSELTDLPKAHTVEAVVIHPRYHTNTIQFDIARLSLRTQSREARPLEIEHSSAMQSTLTVMGFGSTTPIKQSSPSTLQRVNIEEFPGHKCKDLGGPFASFTAEQICAGSSDGSRDSCYGDSGGPLVTLDGKLYGLVSWGVSCGRPGTPAVYTRVAPYQTWVDDPLPADDLTEMIGAIFYAPLIYEHAGHRRRFTARYQTWRPSESLSKSLKTWQRKYQGETYTIELTESSPDRYRLRLNLGKKTYDTAVNFTELNAND